MYHTEIYEKEKVPPRILKLLEICAELQNIDLSEYDFCQFVSAYGEEYLLTLEHRESEGNKTCCMTFSLHQGIFVLEDLKVTED